MPAYEQGLSVMVFSTDKSTNKAVICAGVPEKGDKGKLDVSEWLSNALEPLKGRCGKGKGGLATGQVSICVITNCHVFSKYTNCYYGMGIFNSCIYL